jgi:CRP-like cAMP-binding protein
VFIYGEGTFIGEVDSLFYKKRLNTIVEVVEDSNLVIIQADALNSFLSSNPGLQVLFKDSLIIE